MRRKAKVRILDNFSTGNEENIQPFASEVELVRGDLADEQVVKEAIAGVDYVLHQAALPSVPRSVRDPLSSNRANIDGTLNLLLAARDAKVKKVVYASSAAAYGDIPTLPKTETMATAPLSPYAVTKLAGEHYSRVFSIVYGFPTVALRYFNVFGPNQNPKSQYAAVVPKFITAMLRDERPVIFGDGTQSRDFTYVANNVEANLLAATSEVSGEAINIACGETYTLLEFVGILNEILGKHLEPVFAPERAGDVKHSRADVTKAQRLLGYRPKVSFREGLERTVAWCRER